MENNDAIKFIFDSEIDRAIQLLNDVIERNPKAYEPYVLRALCYNEIGSLKDMYKDLKNVEKNSEYRYDAHRLLANLMMETGGDYQTEYEKSNQLLLNTDGEAQAFTKIVNELTLLTANRLCPSSIKEITAYAANNPYEFGENLECYANDIPPQNYRITFTYDKLKDIISNNLYHLSCSCTGKEIGLRWAKPLISQFFGEDKRILEASDIFELLRIEENEVVLLRDSGVLNFFCLTEASDKYCEMCGKFIDETRKYNVSILLGFFNQVHLVPAQKESVLKLEEGFNNTKESLAESIINVVESTDIIVEQLENVVVLDENQIQVCNSVYKEHEFIEECEVIEESSEIELNEIRVETEENKDKSEENPDQYTLCDDTQDKEPTDGVNGESNPDKKGPATVYIEQGYENALKIHLAKMLDLANSVGDAGLYNNINSVCSILGSMSEQIIAKINQSISENLVQNISLCNPGQSMVLVSCSNFHLSELKQYLESQVDNYSKMLDAWVTEAKKNNCKFFFQLFVCCQRQVGITVAYADTDGEIVIMPEELQ